MYKNSIFLFFTLLVAVALSAQATDVGVNRATVPLFKVVDTPQKMLDLGEASDATSTGERRALRRSRGFSR